MIYWHVLLLLVVIALASCPESRGENASSEPEQPPDSPVGPMPPLSKEEKRIIIDKGTERPSCNAPVDRFGTASEANKPLDSAPEN